MLPKHTFAIPAYGDSPYLKECIESLLGQSHSGSDIILCTSTPDAFLEQTAAEYGLRYFVSSNKSSLRNDWGFALKTAAEQTGAQLVTISHQDDIYHRDYVKALMNAYSYHPDMSVFCTRYRTIDGSGNEINGKAENVKRLLRLPLRLHALADRSLIKKSALILGNSIGCPTCTYNLDVTGTELFTEDLSFVIDWDLLLKLAGRPGRFICVEKELMSYRVHAGAATKANIENHNREAEESMIFRKIWPGPAARLIMHFYKASYSAYD